MCAHLSAISADQLLLAQCYMGATGDDIITAGHIARQASKRRMDYVSWGFPSFSLELL